MKTLSLHSLLLVVFFNLSLCFAPNSSFGYLPRIKTIAAKAVKNNGRGVYEIKREVSLFQQESKINFSETWLVQHGDAMKLTAQGTNDDGSPWKFSVTYEKGKRKTTTAAGKEKIFSWSPFFTEPLFHYRSRESFMDRLIKLHFIPAWARNTPSLNVSSDNITKFTAEEFVKLSRQQGRVNYELGSSVEKTKSAPKMWLEQDSFLIRRAKLSGDTYLTNESFRSFSGNLKFPLLQSISWNDNTAKIKTTSVKRLKSAKVRKSIHASLKGQSAVLPKNKIVKEFFSRFR